MHATDDQLVRRALGERVPDLEQHLGACQRCAAELGELRSAVVAARAEGVAQLPPAPDAVWQRVHEELGLVDPPTALRARRRPRSRWLAVAAAVAGLALGGAALTASLDRGPVGEQLLPVAGAAVAPSASGSVRLTDGARAVVVDTAGLPRQDGYYEVWLLDPDSGRMLALGALREDGTAELPVPEGVAVADYPTVDVSVEQDDGDPAHSGVSALRAPVPSART